MALVIEKCPVEAAPPTKNPCFGKVKFQIIPDKESYKEGEVIKLINKGKNKTGWKWSLGSSDSIVAGGISNPSVTFIYRSGGIKDIKLVNRQLKCRKKIRKISVEETRPAKPPKPRTPGLPRANIRVVNGALACEQAVQFDSGVNGNYDLHWSFSDSRNQVASGNKVWHKFMDETTYTVRVYIGRTEIGRRDFFVPCF